MNHKCTIKIYDSSKRIINDVQLWSNEEQEEPSIQSPNITSCSSISSINYTQLPLYLINSLPFTIYSNDTTTCEYFQKKLIELPLSNNRNDLGLLCKVDHQDTYLVFYNQDTMVKMIIISFISLNKLLPYFNIKSTNSNTLVDFSKPIRSRVSTVLIDKIIENNKKKQRQNPFIANPLVVMANNSTSTTNRVDISLILTSQEQINTAINRIILSGLRMRGLSQNLVTSHNDKLAIKEIHQMTFKATQFALRKQNYSFNKKSSPSSSSSTTTTPSMDIKKPLRLNDLQDIIENLLQLFVDIE